MGPHITVQRTQWKMSVPLLQPIIFVQNPQQVGRGNMKNYGSVKIVNITIENASAIEKMVNQNKKSRKTPAEINRLLYLVKLLSTTLLRCKI